MTAQHANDPRDRADLLKLFLEHPDDLRAFIGAMVRNAAPVGDLFQEVARTLRKRFDKCDNQRRFGAWTRGVAKNRVRKRHQSEGKAPMPLTPTAIEATLSAFHAIHSSRSTGGGGYREHTLEACRQQLPSPSRRRLRMRYEQVAEIVIMAETLRKTVAVIYQSLSRMPKQLELCMRERLQSST